MAAWSCSLKRVSVAVLGRWGGYSDLKQRCCEPLRKYRMGPRAMGLFSKLVSKLVIVAVPGHWNKGYMTHAVPLGLSKKVCQKKTM